MKPILHSRIYAGAEDTILGTLADAVSCTVTEQRNGEYELELEYLPTGVLANSIKTGAVILATPHYGGEYQPFRIYNVEKTLTGTIGVSAHHISYDLTKVYLKYFNDTTGITATLAAIKSNLIQQSGDETDWTFGSDITNETSIFKHPEPTTVRAALGGVEGSLLDTFGGEFEWDNLTVYLHKSRGLDRGVHIRYAGNLLEFTRTEDFEDAYTHVMVYWFDEETGNKTTSLSYPVHDLVAADFTQSRTAVINVTADYETQPNRATLNPVAQEYANKLTSKPTIGLEVKFVDLNSTTEGGAEAPVLLCDTLHVIDPVRDVSISAKVIETKWNVLLDRYDEVTVGTKGKNIADTISDLSGGVSSSSGGGGGGGSTETDYRNLSNKPSINGVELTGDKSLSTLGIASASDLAATTATANAAVKDVTVNGTSVVNASKVAQVTVPTKTSDLTNDSGFITASDIPAAPVTSVNGQTGAVNIAIPDSTSDLTNDSGFITASGAPVQSVNGQTGNVSIDVPTIQQVLASGTEIARVFANSGDQTGTPIYAPAGGGGGGSYSQKLWTGICTTAADVQTKEVTLDDPTGFSLTAGVFILIRFTNGNTKTFPKLTLGGETKNLVSTTVNQNTYSGQTPYHTIDINQPILAVYDGTNWKFDNAYRNKANLWDAALSGTPTAPTAAAGTNTRQLATTAFVQEAIAGISGGSGKAYIGTCDTAQGVPTKVVTCTDFVLETGAVIYVKFTNAHVTSALSLNVNDTGAVTVTNAGEAGGMGALWKAGAVVEFVYDGTNWVMMDHVKATTSYPGIVALSNSTTSNSETAAATSKAVKAAYDNGGVQSVTPDYTSGVKVATFATTGGNVDLYLPVWNGGVSS